MPTHYLACDLGADSGRLMLGTLDDGKIVLEELHRFPNGPVKTAGALHWNIDGLFNELKTGLKKAAAQKSAHRQHQHRFVGRGLCALRRARPDHAAGLVLPRFAHRRRRRKRQGTSGLADDLRRDRHPVHGAQHDLPARRRTARTPRPRQTASAHRRRVQLFLLRRRAKRSFPRQHHAALQSADQNVVEETCSTRSACARICSRRSARPARGSAR